MLKGLGVFVLIFLSLLVVFPSLAKENPVEPEVSAPPDVSGVYDVPNHPELKVRVFVHPPKPTTPAKPNASPSPSATSSNSLVCSLTDPQSNSKTGPAGWHLPNGNWTYQLNLGSVPGSVGSSNLNNIAQSGFSQYTSATGNKVTFLRGSDTSVSRARYDGRNIISWGRASSGTLGVTYVWYYTSSGQAVEVDTIMNNRYPWSLSNDITCADNASYDSKNIMTHELGHWLGLTDEYDSANYGNNTMFGYGSMGEVKKDTLTAGDIAGVGVIYP